MFWVLAAAVGFSGPSVMMGGRYTSLGVLLCYMEWSGVGVLVFGGCAGGGWAVPCLTGNGKDGREMLCVCMLFIVGMDF